MEEPTADPGVPDPLRLCREGKERKDGGDTDQLQDAITEDQTKNRG
jgi:hypothetical protein